jgi:ABC-type glycerol-3-phosphate transport system substrate-binding protein
MQTQLTKKQIIFLAIAGVAVLVVVLVLVGVIPGKRVKNVGATKLEFWGVDNESVWKETIWQFQSAYPMRVSYKQMDKDSYEADLIKALAAGEGPDIFMFDNNWLFKHRDKIVPVPQEKLSLATLQSLFPQVVEQDFVLEDRIYALPLYIDTLILAYNRDYFDQEAIVSPPTTWTEFNADIPILREFDEGGLKKAAFAIGGSSSNIGNAPDLLNLFLMQSGSEMVSKDLRNVFFSNETDQNAFVRYIAYANPNLDVYTWNNGLKEDINLFAEGDASGIFVYSSQLEDIRSRNSLLDVGVGGIPQINPKSAVNYPDYLGLAVLSRTEDQNAAWDFVIFATTDQTSAEKYSQTTGLPPALRFLIDKNKNDSGKDGILARQTLTARSWIQPDPELVKDAFDKTIESVLSGSLDTGEALERLSTQIKDLLITR